MATQAFKNFKTYASLLESELGIKYDAKPYKDTIRAMIDGYCKAMDEGNEHLKTLYVSGLMLRFWDKIGKLEASCPNIGMKGDDFAEWVYDAIMLACEYRKWQKDESVNAQQCINQCIETIRLRRYYDINLDKNKVNYATVSLENPVCEEGDNGSQKTLGDTIADEDSENAMKAAEGADAAKRIVQTFLDKNKIVEAIIMDVIAFGDSSRQVKQTKYGYDEEGKEYKYASYSNEFWRYKAVRILSSLPSEYFEYFIRNYAVKADACRAAIDTLKKANNNKLYRELDAALKTARGIVQFA